MQQRTELRQFLTFAMVGAVGTAVHYMALIALVSSGLAGPLPASAAAFCAGAAINYILNYHFTFGSGKRHREAAIKFYLVALAGLALNTCIMAIGIEALGWHYLLTQLLATGIVLVWNFLANRIWTFREKPRDSTGQ